MTNRLETLIREIAKNKLNGKYNLAQYKEGGSRYGEKVKAIQHKNVCESIVAFAETHKAIPFYFILSVGVSKCAGKESEFNKGYKSFNGEKVEQVYAFGTLYNEYNGIGKRKMSDVTIRLIMRYYEKKSTDINEFKADLVKSKVLGKMCGSRDTSYKFLCNNLNIPIKHREDVGIVNVAA